MTVWAYRPEENKKNNMKVKTVFILSFSFDELNFIFHFHGESLDDSCFCRILEMKELYRFFCLNDVSPGKFIDKKIGVYLKYHYYKNSLY